MLSVHTSIRTQSLPSSPARLQAHSITSVPSPEYLRRTMRRCRYMDGCCCSSGVQSLGSEKESSATVAADLQRGAVDKLGFLFEERRG